MGAPAYAGVFSAWCDLRELVPYAFGYMMAAKVGTGIVAELGSMRISDEIDALEVMGIDSMLFLCATRLLAAWMVLPFMYIAAVGAGFFASYLAVVQQIGEVSSGGFFLIFWMFQNPPDLLYSVIKGMVMATAIVLVGLLLRLQRRRRARSAWAPRRRSRWCSTSCSCTSSGCSARSCSGAPTREPRSEAELMDDERRTADEHAEEPLREEDLRRDEEERRATAETERVSVVNEPQRSDDDEFRWHTGLNRPTGVADAVEFVDVHKAFGRNKILRGLNMGIPEGKISMILGPSGTGKSVCINRWESRWQQVRRRAATLRAAKGRSLLPACSSCDQRFIFSSRRNARSHRRFLCGLTSVSYSAATGIMRCKGSHAA